MSRYPTRKFFMENMEGVHLMAPDRASEFTLCGSAFDIDAVDESLKMLDTKKRYVSCAMCAAIVKHCKHVQVREDLREAQP